MGYRFIVTGGGTSGHINPAITIADMLRSRLDDCSIIFTGRNQGLEGELVPKAGYEFHNIDALPFPMKPSPKLYKALAAMKRGRSQCNKIIKEFKPDAVIGTGGYVCAPLILEAEHLGIPVIIHESNAFPGRANRVVGRKADLVMTGFPDLSKAFHGAGKVVCTGNPIRKEVLLADREKARERLGLSKGDLMVFAMGGSLGAKTINDFIIAAASDPELSNVRFVLSTGKQQTGKMEPVGHIPQNLEMKEYIDNPFDYMSGADISITRAGAVTCAETAAIGACSVMIPYPFAAHDHQTFNAMAFSDIGGAVCVKDDEVKEGKLLPILKDLLKDANRREELRANVKKLAVTDCDDRIFNEIIALIGKS